MDMNQFYSSNKNVDNNIQIDESIFSGNDMSHVVNKKYGDTVVPMDRNALEIANELIAERHVDDNGDKTIDYDIGSVQYDVDRSKNKYKLKSEKFNMLTALYEAFPPPNKILVQTKSTNTSAVNMAKLLYALDVKRWYLPLLLFDTTLNGVDPYDENLPVELQQRIALECKKNLFYYAREACRVPVAGSSTGTHCFFHMGSFTSMYLTSNSISYYLEQPRQTYKTGTDSVITSWFFNFATTESKIGVFSYTDTKAKENLRAIIDVLECLPPYLSFHKYKPVKDDAGNTTSYEPVREFAKSPQSISNQLYGNSIVAKTTGKTQETARNAGRGSSFLKINFDEIGWAKYNWLSYGAAQPAFDEVARVAAENGLPHCISMTSTPPDATTKEGEWLYKLLFEECVPFTIRLFDMSSDEIKRYLRLHGKKDIVFASFMYNELGFNEDWLTQRHRKAPNNETFAVEILLQWRRELSKSPFNKKDLQRIDMLTKNSEYVEFMLNDKYLFKIYEGYKKAKFKKIIMASDVASGGGGAGDYSTIVGTDPDTTEVVFTFRANVYDTPIFADIIAEAHRQLAPKGIVVVERNNMGSSVIALLKNMSDIEPYIYYAKMSEKQIALNYNSDKRMNGSQYKYGFVTGEVSREIMYKEILHTRVNRYKRLFKSADIVREIMSVYHTASGRYDHLPGYHDDLLLAYLFTLYVLYKDTELFDKFGIRQPVVLDDNSSSYNESISNADTDKVFAEEKRDPFMDVIARINASKGNTNMERTMDKDIYAYELRKLQFENKKKGITPSYENDDNSEVTVSTSLRRRSNGSRNSLLPDGPNLGF